MTKDEAWSLANDWAAAWNAHDVDAIIEPYDDAIELTSPAAAQLLGTRDGKVIGKANVRAYFQRGLEAFGIKWFYKNVDSGRNKCRYWRRIVGGDDGCWRTFDSYSFPARSSSNRWRIHV